MPETVIWWVRQDLRIHDNRCLQDLPPDSNFLPVFVLPKILLTPAQVGSQSLEFKRASARRWHTVFEAIIDLRNKLKTLKSDLCILEGDVCQQLLALVAQTNASEVRCSIATGTEEMEEQAQLDRALRAQGKRLRPFWQHTLVDPSVVSSPSQSPPQTFTAFRRVVESRWRARAPLPTPVSLPGLPAEVLCPPLPALTTFGLPAPAQDAKTAWPFQAGESGALARVQSYIFEQRSLGHYKETRNEMIGTEYSSKLSVWLANGALSPIFVYHEVQRYENKYGSNDSTYWLIFELWWRDFFEFVAAHYGSALFHRAGIQKTAKPAQINLGRFARWQQGQTGDELVDAAMRELAATGYLSNRARQNAASYLIHDLGLDWRLGAAWFEYHLMDYSPASNYGNWQYIAGVGNDPRPVRRFNTRGQADRYDAEGSYRKLWL